MEAPLMAMTLGPNSLLCQSTRPILEIGMVLDLPKRGLMEHLLMGVMIGPSDEFDSSLVVAVDHIAATAAGRLSGHCTDLREPFPSFCSNCYRMTRGSAVLYGAIPID